MPTLDKVRKDCGNATTPNPFTPLTSKEALRLAIEVKNQGFMNYSDLPSMTLLGSIRYSFYRLRMDSTRAMTIYYDMRHGKVIALSADYAGFLKDIVPLADLALVKAGNLPANERCVIRSYVQDAYLLGLECPATNETINCLLTHLVALLTSYHFPTTLQVNPL